MTLIELSKQYRQNAGIIKERVDMLKKQLETENLCQMDKLRLRVRIDRLLSIMRETNETALYLERYYDRKKRKNGRLAI